MKLVLIAATLLTTFGCKSRKDVPHVNSDKKPESVADTKDQIVDIIKGNSSQDRGDEMLPPLSPEKPETPVVTDPSPKAYIKPTVNFDEYCVSSKSLEIGPNIIHLITENFRITLSSSTANVQCLITLEATIPQNKRLSFTVPSESFFAGIATIGTGQKLGLDINILTLNGESIESTFEYQTSAQGPLFDDTEFVRYPMLMRRIPAPCNTGPEVKRTIGLQFVLYAEKGTNQSSALVTARDLPKIEYTLENCQ